jgi:hypothetical protein
MKWILLAALLLSGCASNSMQQVNPDEFEGPSAPQATAQPPDPPPAPPALQPITATQPVVMTPPATKPSAVASASEPSVASGKYLALGGVVAQVNNTPIFINKVLRYIEPGLRNDAGQMSADQFAMSAKTKITEAIRVLVHDELFYAAAVQNLDTSDKHLVADLTTEYRQAKITEAGGSIETARRRAAANGDDFDDLIRSQYREYMIGLYQARTIDPFAEPNAEEMREYYQQNIDKFSDTATVVFDMLSIDPSQLHTDSAAQDRQMAYDRAKLAHDRAVAGDDFSTLFKEFNTDPGLDAKTHGTGNMGEYQRGAFIYPQVEDAVWKLQPNQTSDVIEINGVLFLAKLENLKLGNVRPFEDEKVQEAIHTVIRDQRKLRLQREALDKLTAEAIITEDAEMMNTALDISMQNYHSWTGK